MRQSTARNPLEDQVSKTLSAITAEPRPGRLTPAFPQETPPGDGPEPAQENQPPGSAGPAAPRPPRPARAAPQTSEDVFEQLLGPQVKEPHPVRRNYYIDEDTSAKIETLKTQFRLDASAIVRAAIDLLFVEATQRAIALRPGEPPGA